MAAKPVKRRIFSALEQQAYGRRLTVYTVDAPDGTRSYEFEIHWDGFTPQTVLVSQNDVDEFINTVQ